MKFSIRDFFSKCDEVHNKLQIWSKLLKKFITENFIFLCSDSLDDQRNPLPFEKILITLIKFPVFFLKYCFLIYGSSQLF